MRRACSRSPSEASHCPRYCRVIASEVAYSALPGDRRRARSISGSARAASWTTYHVVVAERLMTLRAFRRQRQRILCRPQRSLGPGRRWSAIDVQARRGTTEPRPRLNETRVEGHSLLVVADGPPQARRVERPSWTARLLHRADRPRTPAGSGLTSLPTCVSPRPIARRRAPGPLAWQSLLAPGRRPSAWRRKAAPTATLRSRPDSAPGLPARASCRRFRLRSGRRPSAGTRRPAPSRSAVASSACSCIRSSWCGR